MDNEHEARPVDCTGTPIERGDVVAPIGDPTRPGVVTEVDGLLSVRIGREDVSARPHLVRVVTIRDGRGKRLGPGDVVQGLGDVGPGRPTRVVESVLYGVGMVVLAPDAEHRDRTPVLPVLLVRVGARLCEGDEVVDVLTGALLVVMGPGRHPGTVAVEPVYGGSRREVECARLRRAGGVEDGVDVAADGRYAVPALGDEPDAVAAVERLLGLRHNVVPLPRAAGH